MSFSDAGSRRKRGLLDTNVLYSALHKPAGICGRIMSQGAERTVQLYSIDLAKEELSINLERKMRLSETDIQFIIASLPLEWIPKGVYVDHLGRAVKIVGVSADAAFLAASLATRIPLVTGDARLQTQKIRRIAGAHKPREFLRLISG